MLLLMYHMNPKMTKYFIIGFAYLTVLYPLWARLNTLNWTLNVKELALNLFPCFGLLAFSLLWLHSLCGVFETWLREYINFDGFVHYSSIIILVCLIAHPLLLFIGVDFSVGNIYLYYGVTYIRLAGIAWLLLITYDIGKALKKYQFFTKNWNSILLISNIGFLLTFFHSLALGSDLQSGPLRIVWMFYGITAMLAIVYTYGVKRFLR